MKKILLIVTGVLAALLLLVFGAAWYLSGLVLDGAEIKGDDALFENEVVSITPDAQGDGGVITYRVPDTIEDPAADSNTVSRVGMLFEDAGYLQLEQGATVEGDQVTRPYQLIEGTAPQVGDLGKMDWPSYPNADALGLTARPVTYETPLGAMPAIIVDPAASAPESSTWAVIVHGRNGSVREGLRITPRFAERGITTMLINYRDDKKDPGVPYEDGVGNFGATEWPDLQAAVDYASQAGASDVILVGYSMGGAVVAGYMENGADTAQVTGTILLSPAVSFSDVTIFGAERLGLPTGLLGPVIWLGERVVEMRSAIDYSQSEYIDNASSWPVPALVTAVTEDDLVPPDSIEEFAQDLPDGTFMRFDGAFHTGEWNMDTAAFDDLVNTWLDDQVGAAQP